MSRSITAPLDRLKVLLQVHIEKQSVRTVFQNIMNDGGIWSFWRGNGLNIVKIIPESGIRFYVFETVKRLLHNNRQRKATAYGGEGTATAPGEKKALHLSPHNVSSSTRFIAGGVAGLARYAGFHARIA